MADASGIKGWALGGRRGPLRAQQPLQEGRIVGAHLLGSRAPHRQPVGTSGIRDGGREPQAQDRHRPSFLWAPREIAGLLGASPLGL